MENGKTWTEANDFELLYAKEFRQYLEKSRIIGLFHCNELKHYPELFVSLTQLNVCTGMEEKPAMIIFTGLAKRPPPGLRDAQLQHPRGPRRASGH